MDVKEVVNEAWEKAGEIDSRAIFEQIKKEAGVENACLYRAEDSFYSILYFTSRGKLHALPGYELVGDYKDIPSEISWDGPFSDDKERARSRALFGKYPGEGETVESLAISKVKNQYGEEVTEVGRYLMKWGNRFYLEESRLFCYSSADLGLGTCNCVSHPIYDEVILREVSPPANE